jgi:hypothetical protein
VGLKCITAREQWDIFQVEVSNQQFDWTGYTDGILRSSTECLLGIIDMPLSLQEDVRELKIYGLVLIGRGGEASTTAFYGP